MITLCLRRHTNFLTTVLFVQAGLKAGHFSLASALFFFGRGLFVSNFLLALAADFIFLSAAFRSFSVSFFFTETLRQNYLKFWKKTCSNWFRNVFLFKMDVRMSIENVFCNIFSSNAQFRRPCAPQSQRLSWRFQASKLGTRRRHAPYAGFLAWQCPCHDYIFWLKHI